MKVKVKEEGIKLNGTWKFKGEEAVIDEEQYEKNKDFLDIIEDEEGPKLPQVPGKEDEDNEEELKKLRAKGKELGIKNAHLMGKEKLELVIAEKEKAEKEKEEDEKTDNPDENNTDVDNEKTDVTDNDAGDNAEEEATGESNPQE